MAGAPISLEDKHASGEEAYWEKLEEPENMWAKTCGPGSTALNELLSIDGVCEALGLSFKNSAELNKIIDDKLPTGCPRFTRREVVVGGEAFVLYSQNVLECICALWGDSKFASLLQVAPEHHYVDSNCTIHLYHEMKTGKWWWRVQEEIEAREPGGTVIPIIISSDKTQLTLFGNKTAYMVYLTLGNLPKEIRRKPSKHGQILLAYLPTSHLMHIDNKAARQCTLANLFHFCMAYILKPLEDTGLYGMQVVSGDGVVRRGHPILASFVADYPEQLLVTCCKNFECPSCEAKHQELETLDQGPTEFARACQAASIKPVVKPFWQNLPYTNIYRSIIPDILHQLYQGVIKHLIHWIIETCGAAEVDARCRRLPPNHNIRLFLKGISTLSRVTGKEHAQMSSFLLALVIDIRLPDGLCTSQLVCAVCSLLDFLYLAPDMQWAYDPHMPPEWKEVISEPSEVMFDGCSLKVKGVLWLMKSMSSKPPLRLRMKDTGEAHLRALREQFEPRVQPCHKRIDKGKAKDNGLTEEDIPWLRQQWHQEFMDIVNGTKPKLLLWWEVNHEINLIDKTKQYKYHLPCCPQALKEQLCDKTNPYINAKWWEPWPAMQATPLLCIPKKDGTLQTALDAQQHNDNTVKDVTPLLDQEVICKDVAKAKYRSKIDLTDAYKQAYDFVQVDKHIDPEGEDLPLHWFQEIAEHHIEIQAMQACELHCSKWLKKNVEA
ncbi:hypothetical protein C0992_001897 [Termitomyces sp. T32_za158]|nr:hypothetical protein C0992_001897 [Termitomyces sp. T32_za158]